MNNANAITKTTDNKLLVIPRILAGLPLLGFGVLHFVKPDHFREILIASDIPLVEMNMYAAPAAEALGGILLLLGLYARVGGLLGMATMLVAIYTTVVLSGMAVADLPDGLTEIPAVPPLPLPVMISVASLVVVALGGGAWSLDWKNQSKPAAED
jgi:putative oxidoreductase